MSGDFLSRQAAHTANVSQLRDLYAGVVRLQQRRQYELTHSARSWATPRSFLITEVESSGADDLLKGRARIHDHLSANIKTSRASRANDHVLQPLPPPRAPGPRNTLFSNSFSRFYGPLDRPEDVDSYVAPSADAGPVSHGHPVARRQPPSALAAAATTTTTTTWVRRAAPSNGLRPAVPVPKIPSIHTAGPEIGMFRPMPAQSRRRQSPPQASPRTSRTDNGAVRYSNAKTVLSEIAKEQQRKSQQRVHARRKGRFYNSFEALVVRE